MFIFQEVMDPGIELTQPIMAGTLEKLYPDYLTVKRAQRLMVDDHLDPSRLPAETALIYETNLYITDADGNIAFADMDMVYTPNVGELRRAHPEYKAVGGRRAAHEDMDAGHFGISLGQHPSIAMEQHKTMNRYGTWREFERGWYEMAQYGHRVNVIMVFVEDDGGGTFSPFWCLREDIDGEAAEYILTNDDEQS